MPSPSPDPNAPQDQTQQTRVGYLFGHPISHSLSPLVHNTVFQHLSLRQTYTLYESTSIPSFLSLTTSPSFYGAAITMPHKVTIIPHLHSLTHEGRAIGAINTIYALANPQTGKRELVGTNTDCIGIREALRQNMSAAQYAGCRGRPALVVGGGGTSRAAVYALTQWLGSSRIYMLNRDEEEVRAVIAECSERGYGVGLVHVESVVQARGLETPAVIVSAIPDFPPETQGERLVRDCLSVVLEMGAAGVVDGEPAVSHAGPGLVNNYALEYKPALLEMCYHPSPNTSITNLALSKSWTVIPGTEAMLWQGLEQDRYWTGKDVAQIPELVEEVKKVVGEALELAWKAHVDL